MMASEMEGFIQCAVCRMYAQLEQEFQANALQCYQCHERNAETCKEEEIECPAGERCITISEVYRNNETYHSIFKGCSGHFPCAGVAYAIVNDNLYLATYLQCCDEDLCNDDLFYEMPEGEEPIGPLCPTCYVGDTLEECNGDEEIRCHHKDDKCITLALGVEKPDGVPATYSAKGCASALECKRPVEETFGIKVPNGKTFKCSDPPRK
ncbi:phospholipase A2 inhibitor NAI-like isoform X2 [Dendropsophus ebraccatus]|uniref:phospholipase A2 inhibitor NAI-like isoform X2 n=1 Tax=Dendropsophus ebraccatus TaxID=150705 RepID=UPI00383199D0